LVLGYYRRLLSDAWSEAKRVTAARVISFIAFAVLSALTTWLIAGVSPGLSLAVGLASAVAYVLAVLLWYWLTIPPRIEARLRMFERDIEHVQQKRAVENAMRLLAQECKNTLLQSRREIETVETKGTSVDAEAIQMQALNLASRAQDTLRPYEERFGYTQAIAEIANAVDGAKVDDAEMAIRQLAELQRVIDTQLYVGRYS